VNILDILLLCSLVLVFTSLLIGVVLITWVIVEDMVTGFRRTARKVRRWRRRRARERAVPRVEVLRQGVQIQLRVDPDASVLRREATGLAEPWPQQEADVDAWIRAGSTDTSAH
jgi:hypothetical protein